MMLNWHTGWSWWGWLGMSISMVIFWGLVIWGIVVLMRYLTTPEKSAASSLQNNVTPDRVLAERFARGEIDDQEYAHTREILRSNDQDVQKPGVEGTPREQEVETVTH
jgi:putative membrane protein